MAITSGMFMSVNGDRKINAKWFARYFSLFVGNGVFPNPSSGLQVIQDENMRTIVRTGDGWINGYFIVNDSNYALQHDVADGVLKRIDRVVLRLDFADREIYPVIKKGPYASTPVAPALQRDADAYELALADVLINNGATQISQANITDTRLNTSLCGIVHGTVDQVDTTTIFNQYQSWFGEFTVEKKVEFEAWLDSIKDLLDGDVAANLASRITNLENKVTTHLADYVAHPGVATTTNSGNAYAITLNPAPTEYKNAMGLILTINANSTGASTINVNAKGVIPLKNSNGNPVTNLKKDGVYTVRYSAGAFILQGESEVEIGQQIIKPGTTNQPILKGLHNGTGYVEGSSNLVASNIKQGVNMFGVTGTEKTVRIETIPQTGKPPAGTVWKEWYNDKVYKRFGGNQTPVYRATVDAPGVIKLSVQFRIEHTNYPATINILRNGGYVDSYVCTSTNFHGKDTFITVSAGDVITVTANTGNSSWYAEGTACRLVYQDYYNGVVLDDSVIRNIYY